MTDMEKLGKIPPKEARDTFTGDEEISIRMIEDIENEKKHNKEKINGKKRKFDVSIAKNPENCIVVKVEENTVYRLDDGTITDKLASKEELR